MIRTNLPIAAETSGARMVSFDLRVKAGSLLLPEEVVRCLNLKDKVLLVGRASHFLILDGALATHLEFMPPIVPIQ
ncbi:hypothetical protein [Paramagnetospirillum kuznetsovii]|nr:hypothetical protein [Paramagnetospirillum kuznetsovii]